MSFQAAIDRYDGGVMEVRTEARALERWSVGGRSLFQRDFRRQAKYRLETWGIGMYCWYNCQLVSAIFG